VLTSLALVLAFAANGATPGTSCNGADPAITDVTAAQSSGTGDANRFTIHVTVQNLGSKNQSGDVLQSVVFRL